MHLILFPEHKKAELVERPDHSDHTAPLVADEVRGRTLVSLTSPGTELNWGYLGSKFPSYPGYASVFQIETMGAEVKNLAPGTVVFASKNHQSWTRAKEREVVPVPAGLKPEVAVFARLMGVSMTTLNTTTAHPPARVLITGLGPVGNLAAQIFQTCGYEVTAVDPTESRRQAATLSGLLDVRASIADGAVDLTDKVALHVECSGHEKAVLDGCKCVRKRGEVVLVGVPWARRTELSAFDLLHAVFHRYVILRSGWEWEVPHQPQDFAGHSLRENYVAALRWLAEGKVKVEHLATCYAPARAQEVYSGLVDQSLPTPAALFDWRLL